MTEVLHSFQGMKMSDKGFALKVDLFKAFGTVTWSYLHAVLQKFNFPQHLTNLVISYITGSKFSIKLNSAACDGFITPRRGLR
jgi:hypothetical protein